jgi:hypothetical protein
MLNFRLNLRKAVSKPVTFSRLPGGASYYWGDSYGGLRFSANTGNVMNWCIIEHSQIAIGIWVTGNILTLNNVTIRNNQDYGVNFFGDTNNRITHSGVNERFANNGLGNVKLYGTGGAVVDKLP